MGSGRMMPCLARMLAIVDHGGLGLGHRPQRAFSFGKVGSPRMVELLGYIRRRWLVLDGGLFDSDRVLQNADTAGLSRRQPQYQQPAKSE